MMLSRTILSAAALLLAGSTSLPAVAQSPSPKPAASARPVPTAKPVTAPKPATPPAAPALSPAWSVTADQTLGTVEIGATAKDGGVQAILSCKAGDAGLSGMFTGYRGDGLRTDGEVEAVAVYARGADWQDAFALRLRYSAANRTWAFARPMSPIFLASFSRGATLAVVNSRNQEIFVFDLTGSTAATKALRTVCGLK